MANLVPFGSVFPVSFCMSRIFVCFFSQKAKSLGIPWPPGPLAHCHHHFMFLDERHGLQFWFDRHSWLGPVGRLLNPNGLAWPFQNR